MSIQSIENKRLAVPFEVKAEDIDEQGHFKGLGSVFGNEDSYGDIVVDGAFSDSIKEWNKKKSMPALLWQHWPDKVIGKYTALTETKEGLLVEGQLALGVQQGKEAYELLKMDAISGLSIGYSVVEYKFDSETEIRELTKLDLWEVSLVTFPANDKARITDVKEAFTRGELPTEREFEKFLRDSGISRSVALGIISKGYKHVAGLRDSDSAIDEEVKQALLGLAESMKGINKDERRN